MTKYKYNIEISYGMPFNTKIDNIISKEYNSIEEAKLSSLQENHRVNNYSNIRWIRTKILNDNNRNINDNNCNIL